MIERWWGRRDVFAEDFTPLVRSKEFGIRTTDLAAAARTRGWRVDAITGTAAVVQETIGQGVPVIALIEVRPGRYHYVVVLAWQSGVVTVHDPARAPRMPIDEVEFLRAWEAADRWAMVMRPGPAPAQVASVAIAVAPPLPCPPWLDRAVDAAAANRLSDANTAIDSAARICPREPLVLRETAAIRFKEERYFDAELAATRYLFQTATDTVGWNLLGASRFMTGNTVDALSAWNRIGKPRIDLVNVRGLARLRVPQLVDAASLAPRTLLTPRSLTTARRRIEDLPTIRAAAIDYRPVPGGLAEVEIAVSEIPMIEPPRRLLIGTVARAIGRREVDLMLGNLTGAGELWWAGYRWSRARPRLAFRLDVPVDVGGPAILTLSGVRGRFRFESPGSSPDGDSHRAAAVTLGTWTSDWLRPSIGLGIVRWEAGPTQLVPTIGLEARGVDDRLRVEAGTDLAVGRSGHPGYRTAHLAAGWVSTPRLDRAAWSARTGITVASRHAPRGAWAIAGNDPQADVLLRAHVATNDGAIRATLAAPTIVHGGVGGSYPLHRGLISIAATGFVDVARLAGRIGVAGENHLVDVGGGVAIGLGDGSLGALTVEVAHGLRDGATALAIGARRTF